MRPPGRTDEQGSDWFSIFVLHQNRVEHGYGQKNAIKPEYLGRFLDLVIWGHEHECIPDPWVSHCMSCAAWTRPQHHRLRGNGTHTCLEVSHAFPIILC